jgi:glycerol-3-phosphate dehydrogenase
VWSDGLRSLLGTDTGPSEVRQSKGVHLVVPRWTFPSSSAVIARTPHSVLFLLPWSEHWLVGTTDTDYSGALENPGVDPQDVDYLLDQANRWLVRPISRSDVVGVYAGLRPLVAPREPGGPGTTQVSREHVVMHPRPGMVAIAGGKYTTYRVMAAEIVDAAVADLPNRDQIGPSVTHELPLVGAEGFRAAWGRRVRTARNAQMPVESVERLLRRHGDRTRAVLDLIRAHPELGLPLHPQGRVVRAEAVIAARDEGARTLADILIRRTRLAMQTSDRGLAAAGLTGHLVAPILGWDEARIAEETDRLADLQPTAPR